MVMGFTRVPLTEGVGLLQTRTSEIIWRGRSLFLCAGCEDVFPRFRVSLISDADQEPDHFGESDNSAYPSDVRCVAIAFEADENTCRWALGRGVELLLASREVVGHLGDKTQLFDILKRAHIRSIPGRLCEAKSYPDTEQIWCEFKGKPVVVQRGENNLTGKGTRLVSHQRELSEVFAEWGEHRLKISQYLDGTQLTISGCVGSRQTIVSAISRQLVGIPRLTCYWGAHCGNQLVNGSDLENEVAVRCFEICKRVGDELRRRGFLGAFGLDLLQTPENEVFVVEINPRLQSVSSLINIAEIEANMLPIPGVHLLSFLLDQVPVVALTDAPPVPPLSQIVLYARRRGLISKAPANGRYHLGNGALMQMPGQMSLRSISSEEAVIWNFVKPGEYVQEDTRLCVLQTRFYLAEATSEANLTNRALELVDALESQFKLQA